MLLGASFTQNAEDVMIAAVIQEPSTLEMFARLAKLAHKLSAALVAETLVSPGMLFDVARERAIGLKGTTLIQASSKTGLLLMLGVNLDPILSHAQLCLSVADGVDLNSANSVQLHIRCLKKGESMATLLMSAPPASTLRQFRPDLRQKNGEPISLTQEQMEQLMSELPRFYQILSLT